MPADHDEIAGLLARAGLSAGAVLGSGAEGTVVVLDDTTVAKVWSGRRRADLEPLQGFYDGVRAGRPAVSTPRILDLLEVDGRAITVEERLRGRPLWVADGSSPDLSTAFIDAMTEALAALAGVPGSPELRLLPILPDEAPLDPVGPFERELAGLVSRRVDRFATPLRSALPDVDAVRDDVLARLQALPSATPVLVHGDLIAANVLHHGGRASAVIDFGFLSTAGDSAFDVAVAASCFDMYGPDAREVERTLDRAFAAAFGPDEQRLAIYRAAYALVTACSFGTGLDEGHFAWCVAMLQRPEVREAIQG